ncbi:hypothetical protein CLV97_1555 [Planifilum fimeticola]|uniref:Uncharacterized protein n=1 Tax=Planifilum fimeticola TaxID=201975 RepID=A0A2T0LAE0_9BACL|nr:hypothetical protein CLV97_1555 [Planifilum fimeticola]
MVKKLLILGIIIAVLVVVYFTLYFIDVSGQILKVDWQKVVVNTIEEYGFTEEQLVKREIDPKQAKDIVNHPNHYRHVNFVFRLNNDSAWAAVGDIQIEAHLPEEAKERLVWMEGNLFMSYVGTVDNRPDGLTAIFKMKEGDTETDLIEICKQIHFTLTGKKLGLIDHGSISVPIQYRGD